jgi:transcriptional regulator with XRE-family HTH domain
LTERNEEVRRMVSDTLELATASLQEIADEAGISYDTLWAWSNGRRNPTAENLHRLADAIERRSDRLRKLAGELRTAADKE